MLYVDFNAGGKDYRLRLTTRDIVSLEKRIGCNPLAIFGDGDTLHTITTMVAILHASLQTYEHGLTLDDAYKVFDAWLADGHTMTDFIQVIVDIFKASGLIKDDRSEKN